MLRFLPPKPCYFSRPLLILAGVLWLSCLGLRTRTVAEEVTQGDTVGIGVVGSLFRDMPERMIQVVLKPFRTVLEAQTGFQGRIVVAQDAETLGQQLDKNQVQLGVFHGFEFAWAQHKYPKLKPLVIVVNQTSALRGYVVVRKDSNSADLADLRGQSLALPRRTREHCRLFLERHCLACGEPAEQFFARISKPTSIEEALDEVVNGAVQVTVADGAALDWYRQRKAGCYARLKLLQESEVFPAGVLAYHPGNLDDAQVRRFQDGLTHAHQTDKGKQLLALCQISSFESVPADYEQHLAEIVKVYPPPATAAGTGQK